MPNWCSCVLVLRHLDISDVNAGEERGPRLAVDNGRPLTVAEAANRAENRRVFLEHASTVQLEPDALPGPALPTWLQCLEYSRETAHRVGGEIHSVHCLEQAWAPPIPHLLRGSEQLREATLETSYIMPDEDSCGAATAKNGDALASFEADLDAAMEAAKELSPDELRGQPTYLGPLRWFLTLRAQRLAGLRSGPVVDLPKP